MLLIGRGSARIKMYFIYILHQRTAQADPIDDTQNDAKAVFK